MVPSNWYPGAVDRSKRVLCANVPELAWCDLLEFLQDGRH